MPENLIELRHVAKSYGSVAALSDIHFHVGMGEVVGLIGDNGAGKSTLIKILSGALPPTSGDILVRGMPVIGWNTARARAARIETVFQGGSLVMQQSIVRNIFLGRELTSLFGFLDTSRERAEATRLMRAIGFTAGTVSPETIVGRLSGGERQGIALARAIYHQADLIIMDEPTNALSLTETEKVFHFVRSVRAAARSVLFIAHNIHHVYGIADRFIVLDRGRVVLERSKAEVASAEALIDLMQRHPAGREMAASAAPYPAG